MDLFFYFVFCLVSTLIPLPLVSCLCISLSTASSLSLHYILHPTFLFFFKLQLWWCVLFLYLSLLSFLCFTVRQFPSIFPIPLTAVHSSFLFFRWRYFAVYFTVLSFPRVRSARGKAITQQWTESSLEGGSIGHIEVTSRYLGGGTEKNNV
jgi:hypothetical protein